MHCLLPVFQDLSGNLGCKDPYLHGTYISKVGEESQKISVSIKDSKLPRILEGNTYMGEGEQQSKGHQEHQGLGNGLQF